MGMTPNVTLRPYVPEDAETLSAAVRESAGELMPWMPWCVEAYDAELAAAWIATTLSGRERGTMFDFAIFRDGEFAGACGLNQISTANRVANLGYWVRTPFAGQGIATAGARQLVEWALRFTDLNRLEILVAVDNHASLRVAEKIGAQRDAVLEKRLMLLGKPCDAVLFSIVRRDG